MFIPPLWQGRTAAEYFSVAFLVDRCENVYVSWVSG
jgi:hypothetical protein